ncbi:DUF962 domain-containing protein [Aliikangiella coralliicola]|uniref:DUF962 domain-containing protein n=1 Tax=Aliikangiella coralliicola TaxID=2592383 RepID=A0A545UI58_9GAMM|nr:DUF962 domain-containing protein [Aliikangiella coralliicola]TQV89151.1 DUF962 domain-containing protein [Aliikangiella coralliicola]
MNQPEYHSFSEFWPFYLGEHKMRLSRALHYMGTVLSHLLLVYLLIFQLWHWLPIVLLVGYGPAWIGHFFIEKNRPATFKHPFWSLRGDYKMLYLAATGQLSAELSRLFGKKARS